MNKIYGLIKSNRYALIIFVGILILGFILLPKFTFLLLVLLFLIFVFLISILYIIGFSRDMLDKKKYDKQYRLIECNDDISNISIPTNLPLPFAVIDSDKNIFMYNKEFKDIFSIQKIDDVPILDLIKDFNFDIDKQKLDINDRAFEIYSNKSSVSNSEDSKDKFITTISMVDITENEYLKKQVRNQLTVVGLIFIDNYEEVIESIEDTSIPLLSALIDRKLNSLASEVGGIIKKLEKDRYIFLLSLEMLEHIKEKKFEILNQIKEIDIGNHMAVTLSIGIGLSDEKLEIAMKNAKAAIDLALGRGGDQVLIKDGENYLFYGGKSSEISHNARIRARVKADALSELIAESNNVLIMGHKQADLDSLGASIGIYRICKTMGKTSHIIMDEASVGVKRLRERLSEHDEYDNLFISCQESINSVTEKTLVVVIDTHRHSMVECTELLDLSNKVVVFDHHRKSTDFIDNAVLIYHEPYASSTSELVTEMIQYIGEKVRLKPIEADALLGGITVDTKNFCMKTGAITFEAAAYLRRNGADSIRVRLLFQNDLEAYKAKASAVRDAEIFMENIAISECPSNVENSSLTSAQAADDLLNIVGIKASFVLCLVGDTVYCSARSLGEVNVQVILEKLGGGGHLTMSGAQFRGIDIKDVKEMIKSAIANYLEEEK